MDNGQGPISYGVNARYFQELGISFDRDRTTGSRPDGILGVTANSVTREQYVWVDYQRLDEAGLREVMDLAFNDIVDVEDFTPINFSRSNETGEGGVVLGNNPSNGANIQGGGRSSFVTFEDESKGVDFQLILSPRTHWQFIINYAYIERETTSPFQLVGAIDEETGNNYGTEYDLWNYWLGQDAFDDPTDPSSISGGGIQGTSLYFGPKHSASMWTKYTIQEGVFERLGLGLGVIYTGSAPTSIPIGSRQLLANPYRTPNVPERFRWDAALSYQFYRGDYLFRFNFNIYNMFNHRISETTAVYNNPETGGEELRRTNQYYAPRTFRFSASISF